MLNYAISITEQRHPPPKFLLLLRLKYYHSEWVYRDEETKNRKGKEEAEEDECNEELDSLEMMVPQLTEYAKAIKLLKSSEAVKNLGLFAD